MKIDTLKNERWIYLLLSISSLSLGFYIYGAVRKDATMIICDIVPQVKLLMINNYSTKVNEIGKTFFILNLPSGRWLFSGLTFIRFVWLTHKRIERTYYIIFCIIALILEIGQLNDHIPGTFDLKDILAMILAIVCENIFNFGIKLRGTR
jgi:hypothetical protein